MDPITQIARDTGIPRDALKMAVAQAVQAYRPKPADVDVPTSKVVEGDPDGEHGELISMHEASRRHGVHVGTLSGWLTQGRLTTYSPAANRQGSARLVDDDEVRRLAAEPRRPGPRGPRRAGGAGRRMPRYVNELTT